VLRHRPFFVLAFAPARLDPLARVDLGWERRAGRAMIPDRMGIGHAGQLES